ncbi:MAG: DUF1146 domain-containing protein [Alicyclobacillus sp.]|nr:DUF1146 domain-containing protein [Alicyclobacillus sp.]
MWNTTTSPVAGNLGLLAADGLLFMVVFFAGTYFTWWAIGILRWEQFVHDPHGPQARMLRFILAVFGGLVFALIALLYVVAVQALRAVFV